MSELSPLSAARRAPHFKRSYTSNELPHIIANLPFECPGNPELGPMQGLVSAGQGAINNFPGQPLRQTNGHRERAALTPPTARG